jgi:hypothetical protein
MGLRSTDFGRSVPDDFEPEVGQRVRLYGSSVGGFYRRVEVCDQRHRAAWASQGAWLRLY